MSDGGDAGRLRRLGEIPAASAGMTEVGAGMTEVGAGVTEVGTGATVWRIGGEAGLCCQALRKADWWIE